MTAMLPSFWLPPPEVFVLSIVNPPIDDAVQDLETFDYIAATLSCVFYLGVQLRFLMFAISVLRSQRLYQMRGTHGDDKGRSSRFLLASIIISALYFVGGFMYIVAFGLRLRSLRRLVYVAASSGFDNGDPYQVCGGHRFCLNTSYEFYWSNIKYDTAIACMMQIMVHLADCMLIYRCYIVFSDKLWVFVLSGIPFVVSLGAKHTLHYPSLLIRYDTAGFSLGSFGEALHVIRTHGFASSSFQNNAALNIAPHVFVGASVAVNVLVSASITIRVLCARRRSLRMTARVAQDLSMLSRSSAAPGTVQLESSRAQQSQISPNLDIESLSLDEISLPQTQTYANVSAFLWESAAPSAAWGILTFAVGMVGRDHYASTSKASLTIRMVWVNLTVMAPQMIALSVIQRQKQASKLRQLSTGYSNPTQKTLPSPITDSVSSSSSQTATMTRTRTLIER
ncbi:hypothetical protein DFP72DRAFT_414395 [Ephemerocybe angulata]|uniref:Uncharacterized protein n=1 Tax=Ephemerocybe angulata TaxID=980116 RepID=A0A8H6IHY0_9AGAR|nr:hypothetical protein DFP72DRAFT_414395 [Tulosesus angulatus]